MDTEIRHHSSSIGALTVSKEKSSVREINVTFTCRTRSNKSTFEYFPGFPRCLKDIEKAV